MTGEAEPDPAPSPDTGLTVAALERETAEMLGNRAAARWVCETAVGLDGAAFNTAAGEPVTVTMVRHRDEMVRRHLAGEPLQYVLGRWGFRTLDLAVDRRVLIPRPETEWVAGVAIDLAEAHHRVAGSVRVADLGTGSGAIGLSLAAELPLTGTEVWITDVDPDALDVARANLAGLGQRARAVRASSGSWFEALVDAPRHGFDVIVSNPPYVAAGSPDVEPAVVAWEPERAVFAGPDGLDHIRVLVEGAPAYLTDGGWLVLEIGADQADAVRALLLDRGFDQVAVAPDPAGRPRIATGRWPDSVRS